MGVLGFLLTLWPTRVCGLGSQYVGLEFSVSVLASDHDLATQVWHRASSFVFCSVCREFHGGIGMHRSDFFTVALVLVMVLVVVVLLLLAVAVAAVAVVAAVVVGVLG